MSFERDGEQLLLELDREADDDRGLDAIVAEGRRRFDKALALEKRPTARVGIIDSPMGRLFIADGPRGILAIHFMDGKGLDPLKMMRGKFDIIEDQAAADRIGEEIRRFVGGDRAALTHDIDLSLVESDFK